MRVVDGMHRLRVAQLKGYETIEATFFGGGEDDAFIMTVTANMGHGQPLALADRERRSPVFTSFDRRHSGSPAHFDNHCSIMHQIRILPDASANPA